MALIKRINFKDFVLNFFTSSPNLNEEDKAISSKWAYDHENSIVSNEHNGHMSPEQLSLLNELYNYMQELKNNE